MRLNDHLNRFLKIEISKSKEVSTGSVLLDRAFGIPLRSFMLIQGEAYSGSTALILDLCAQLSKEHIVVYFDVFNKPNDYRLHDINLENFIICPSPSFEFEQFMEIVNTICSQVSDPVFVLDNLAYLERDPEHDLRLSNVARRIRSSWPQATIIATQRKGFVDPLWAYIISIESEKNIYDDSEGESVWQGHIAKIKGPRGETKVFIEYQTGRLSKAFEHAKLEIENGKSEVSKFSLDGVEKQGVWKFIFEHNRNLKCGY
jgi:hypothetical protein